MQLSGPQTATTIREVVAGKLEDAESRGQQKA
jgi:hypothetical protein